ncbi:MAG TPA: hypothetical protein VF179_28750 [Thermoanaerobaculia bacterium]|nr:hypothetical protein [Thermoanaerobaculia bacterium]
MFLEDGQRPLERIDPPWRAPGALLGGVARGSGGDDARKPRSFWASYQEFRRKFGDLEVETQDAFTDVRDPSPGRDFSW